jgi:RNA polymerase sigma-70 factor (ECF subfamily)
MGLYDEHCKEVSHSSDRVPSKADSETLICSSFSISSATGTNGTASCGTAIATAEAGSNGPEMGSSLVLAAKNEHSTGFATLSYQYKEQLFRAAHRITRTHEDAEDAVQDTFLRAFVHLGDFEGRSNFGTWLTRITINSALMILRRKRATHETAMGDSDDFGDGLRYEITDHAPNPETRHAQTEELRILKTAIQRLRPNLRVVVQIHLQGGSMRETAETLGISLSAAKGRLFHAKKALRRSVTGKRVSPSLDLPANYVSCACVLLGRTREHGFTTRAVESEKKGDEDVIEIQGTSKRGIPSNICPTGGGGQSVSGRFAEPRGNPNSSLRNLYGTWRAAGA